MPHRINEFRAKIQFITFAEMPSLIYRACKATNTVSNTRYIQEAVCRRLSEDLGLDLEGLLAALPEPKANAAVLIGPSRKPEKKPRNLTGVRR